MKIASITVQTFRHLSNTVRDSEGHGHPAPPGEPPHEATQSLVTITTDDGFSGYAFGSLPQGPLENAVKPAVLGKDPFYREKIWHELKERQRLNLATLADRILTVVDLALWDLAGRILGQPVHKLLGATRDKVPAYASTMCGDDLPGGLATPEDYANFAIWCVKERGYPAFKLHTWQPPYPNAPSVKNDLAACAAVREAVGPDIPLMLDPFHYYSREEALALAKGLEKLDYYWMEEPMDEHSMSSYVWLCENTSLPICGPETAEGKMHVRAEWIKAGACDLSRGQVDLHDVGQPRQGSYRRCRQRRFDHGDDVEKADPSRQEGGHRHLVRGIEHRRSAAPGNERLPGESQGGEADGIRGLERQPTE